MSCKCKKDKSYGGVELIDSYGFFVYVKDGSLHFEHGGEEESEKINFCPLCGEKLEEKKLKR